MTQKCKCCGRTKDTRMGFCFDCVECESVIVNGLTMFDEEIPKIEGVSKSMSKLFYILEKYGLVKQEIEKL
jgi:hypothetical protein